MCRGLCAFGNGGSRLIGFLTSQQVASPDSYFALQQSLVAQRHRAFLLSISDTFNCVPTLCNVTEHWLLSPLCDGSRDPFRLRNAVTLRIVDAHATQHRDDLFVLGEFGDGPFAGQVTNLVD